MRPRLTLGLHTMRQFVGTFVVLLCLACVGCATPQGAKRDPRDPLEPINRATYKFNDAVDRAVLRPVARGYRAVTPDVVETGVSNFFTNLEQPTVILSELLQAKFQMALADTGRFLLNTVVGVGGIFDPATAAGLPQNDEDLGQAFGKWGIGPGPYLVIPFFGPSTVRDGIGSVGEIYTSPLHYVERDAIRYGLRAVDVIDTRARLLDADQALREAFDPYSFLRNAYLQRREYLVSDGAVSPAIDEELEDPEPEADAPTP
jgi:phospholipid-binding lipoprotein MlaA